MTTTAPEQSSPCPCKPPSRGCNECCTILHDYQHGAWCENCHGTGLVPRFPTLRRPCPTCQPMPEGPPPPICPTCQGRSWLPDVTTDKLLAIGQPYDQVRFERFSLGLIGCHIGAYSNVLGGMDWVTGAGVTPREALLRALLAQVQAEK